MKTVKQLIKELQTLDQDRIVLVSVDAEGNDYEPYEEVVHASYEKDEYFFEVGIDELDDELRKEGYEEEDVKSSKCVVIYPA